MPAPTNTTEGALRLSVLVSPEKNYNGRVDSNTAPKTFEEDIVATENLRKRKQLCSSTPSLPSTDGNEDKEWFYPYARDDPLYHEYMTKEWGHEKFYQTDNQIFEKLSLDGAQAGLSWRTILHKREAYRKAFHQFDIDKVASMTSSDIDEIVAYKSDNSSEMVVRHRGKLESFVHNAKVIQALKSEGVIPSFKEYIWSFVDHKPILNSWKTFQDIPSKTMESEAMSEDMKKKGLKFVGPTTIYAFMQSCGLVIDHPVNTKWWVEAEKRLKAREGKYQSR